MAHKEIDLKNPATNRKNAGFTDEEQGKMSVLQDPGLTDMFRSFYPYREGASEKLYSDRGGGRRWKKK